MGYRIVCAGPRQIAAAEYPEPALAPAEVRIRTIYSGISAGTELATYRGSNPYLSKRWDAERRLFRGGAGPSLAYPVTTWGYEEVGEIVETGGAVSRVRAGDRVWGTWGHKSTHVAEESWAADRILPSHLDPLCGIYSHIGAVALTAVLDADIHVGEYVAVFGLGVAGQIVTRLARLNGATVIAVDAIPGRLDLARTGGADYLINFREQDPAEAVKAITGNRGADVSIEITGFYAALQDAIRATAYNSRVVCSGFFQGEGQGLFLGEEFHHNRIQVICSQISGVGPALSQRWNRLRLNRTIMELQAGGRLDLVSLVSRIYPAGEAAEAFRTLDEDPAAAMQLVLKF